MTYTPKNMALHRADDAQSVYRLQDGFLAIPTPPPSSHETEHVLALIDKALEQLDTLEGVRAKVNTDPGLTEVGKAERLASFRRDMESVTAQTAAELSAHRASLADMEARIYAPPKIDPTDAVTVAEDIEIRGLMRSMKPQEQAETLAKIGENPRMMAALLRSPIPMPGLSAPVSKVWRDHVERTHPDYPRFALADAASSWAAQVMPQIQQGVGFAQRTSAELAQAEIQRRQAA